MDNVEQMRNDAHNYYKSNNYIKAIELYEKLWKNYRSQCSNKDWNIYAWTIYKKDISNAKEITPELLKNANLITGLVKQKTTNDNYADVYVITILKVVKLLKDESNTKYDIIINFLKKINPDYLSTTPKKFNDQKEFASDAEDWYSLMSKALYETKQYEDCIKISQAALQKFTNFHYDNDIWLKRNLNLSKIKSNKTNHDIKKEAIKDLISISLRKDEWFIYFDIAIAYKIINDLDNAIKYATKAALSFGDYNKKIKVYSFLGSLLKEKGKIEETKLHVYFVYLIRKSNNWSLDQQTSAIIKELNINTENNISLHELKDKLEKIWEELYYPKEKIVYGTIKTILSNNKAGFIVAEDKQYYFSTKSFKGNKNQLQPDLKVTFYLEDSYDAKKNIITKAAVNIKPIN